MNDREERQRAALEAALADSFDEDTLAVYADRLLAAGDPRGELIAIDLEIDRHGSTPALVARRTSLVHGWLGHHMPLDPHGAWIGDSLRRGFVEELRVDDYGALRPRDLPAVLASPIAPYIRAIAITATLQNVGLALAHLATRPHAYLQRLALSCTSGGDAPLELGALIRATPRLHTLELRGNRVLARCDHPGVRTLRVTGHDALVEDAPRVEVLDYALGDGRGWDEQQAILTLPDEDALPALLPRAAFPALRTLDLARNEPEALSPSWYGGDEEPDHAIDVFAWLATVPVLGQLRVLRVPSVRSVRSHEVLARTIAALPALEELVVARGHYKQLPRLHHAHARIDQPPRWPWPRPSRCAGNAVRVAVDSAHEVDVPIADAAHVMERTYETLAPSLREVWRAFWNAAAAGRTFTFEVHRLRAAVEAVEIPSWRELRMALREVPVAAPEVVEIRHVTFDPW